MRVKRLTLGVGVGAGLLIGLSSLAWACTSQAWLGDITPTAGPPGTRATVTGKNFAPGPVEIRWNTNGGTVLATASGPSFSVAVTIPEVAPDVYTVVAVARQGTTIIGQASTAFEVTPAAAAERGGYTSSTGDGGQTGGTQARTSTGSARAPGSSGSSTSPADASATTSTEGGDAAFPAEEDAAAPSGSRGVASGGNAQVATTPAGAAGSAAARTASAAALAGTPGGVGAAVPLAGQATPAVASEGRESQAATPSARTVWGDPASGFSDGLAARGASILDDHGSSSGPSHAALGVSALSLGLVALSGGFGLAEARRRRARATTPER